MKTSNPIVLAPPFYPGESSRGGNSGFTLTDLLVVIVMLAVLGMLVLPAFAGIQVKSGRVQCANNLRQIGVATMIYTGEYGGWLPIWGGTKNNTHARNALLTLTYSTFVASGSPGIKIPTNNTWVATGGTFENLGYLYENGLAGNGQIFYCPDMWGTGLGANAYAPLLTCRNGFQSVRSPYFFNPHVFPTLFGPGYSRRYQKIGDLEPHKLLAVDEVGPGLDSGFNAHLRERGWNVLFTDGGVNFSRNDRAINLLSSGAGPNDPGDAEQNFWPLFEQDN